MVAMTLMDDDTAAGEAVDDPMALAVGAVLSVVTDVAERDGTTVDVVDVFGTFHEPPAPERGPLADLVDTFLDAATSRVASLLGDGGQRERAAALGDLARLCRGAEAATVAVADDVERRGGFFVDGHRTIKHWLLASVREPSLDALRQVQTIELVRDCPRIGRLLAEGRIGIAQVRQLARVRAHPRAGRYVIPVIDQLVDWAVFDDHDLFVEKLREFERLVDINGANQDADEAHRARGLRLSTVGETTYLSGQMTNAQAAAIKAVVDAFSQTEYFTDCEHAKALHGDDYSQSQLARSARQRRMDALSAICEAAANAPLDGNGLDVCVNVVIDVLTFQRQLALIVDPLHRHPELFATDDVADDATGAVTPGLRSLCQTIDGLAVSPADAVVAALYGHVRRVVVAGDGVIIDVGRRRRLFTGAARDAAILQGVLDRNGRCTHPGCTRVSHCQIDHTVEWQDGGATNLANANIECGPHNRFKTSRGFTTRRDAQGHWHTYRPDHTEIRAA